MCWGCEFNIKNRKNDMDLESSMNLNKKKWDYTMQAPFYRYRPNYAEEAIDKLCNYVGAKTESYLVADVGAGTGNLTFMFVKRGLECIAVEPNVAMRAIGIDQSKGIKIKWVAGTGEKTGLDTSSIDLYAMGSSFNTTDETKTLQEAWRILKPDGYFSCMWNHRDLIDDPVQKSVEEIIRHHIPNYSSGSRREDPTNIIQSSNLFKGIHYIEKGQCVTRTVDEYMNAWSSVKNEYWDLSTSEGRAFYERIVKDIRSELQHLDILKMHYTSRIWTVQKINKARNR